MTTAPSITAWPAAATAEITAQFFGGPGDPARVRILLREDPAKVRDLVDELPTPSPVTARDPASSTAFRLMCHRP
ncbi:MAG: hypothetical protein IIB28_10150 [Chloroflexi bacterium]|nr:hypothetical protein [Chloroflexota bacterium]